MVPGDRRGADRYRVPEGVKAEISGVAVRLVELSMIGAKVEHEDRFPLTSPEMTLEWEGSRVALPVRVARSEIVGRREGRLLYHTGITIVSTDSVAQELISAILHNPDAAPLPAPPVIPVTPATPAPPPALDDTWTRQVRFLKDDHDHDLPYAQFRLMPTGWEKEYVGAPIQPADGFTIPRDRRDFHELQRTFEAADPETRRMMQIALESQLGR